MGDFMILILYYYYFILYHWPYTKSNIYQNALKQKIIIHGQYQ